MSSLENKVHSRSMSNIQAPNSGRVGQPNDFNDATLQVRAATVESREDTKNSSDIILGGAKGKKFNLPILKI